MPEITQELILLIIPIFLIIFGLMVAALLDLSRRERVTGGNKLLWVPFIVLFQIVGPLAYFMFGRKD